MRRITLILLLFAAPTAAQTWTQITPPGSNHRGWLKFTYDTQRQRTIVNFAAPDCCAGTFGQAWQGYSISSNDWVTITTLGTVPAGGAGNDTACPADLPGGNCPHPGVRHPYKSTAWDSTRNRLWQFGGTMLSGGSEFRTDDLWYLPSTGSGDNAWVLQCDPCGPNNVSNEAAMTYDSTNDVLVYYGGLRFGSPADETWLFCFAVNAAIGCATANAWNQVSGFTGGTTPGTGHGGFGRNLHELVFNTALGKVFMFGGSDGTSVQNQTWTYEVSTKTWALLSPATVPPALRFPPMAYDTARNRVTLVTADGDTWYFDNSAQNWVRYCTACAPTWNAADYQTVAMSYDVSQDKFLFAKNLGLGAVQFWTFALPSAAVDLFVVTVQEALQPGVSGLARTSEPVSVGLPLKDSDAITAVTQLTLKEPVVGQFRSLATWPSGNIKWILVDTQVASLSAGGTATFTLQKNGAGNFGGTNLATDGGTTISVATGAATFTVRKANFNFLDQVNVGGVNFLTAGHADGLVLLGPANPGTTCANPPTDCTTLFKSASDATSTATIEENGPARATIKADGALKDSGGNVYMRFTARLHFYKNKPYVRAVVTLRNADDGAAASFAVAHKGYRSLEIVLSPSLGATRSFVAGEHTGVPVSGSISGTNDVAWYSGFSNSGEDVSTQGFRNTTQHTDTYLTRTGASPFTYAQEGYRVKNGATLVASGTKAQVPDSFLQLKDSTGKGVIYGHYRGAAYWPSSLEASSGGVDVRLGLWADETIWDGTCGATPCNTPHWQPWPQYSIREVWLYFHTADPASPRNEFLKFQHYLLGRASRTRYNDAGVFIYQLSDPVSEDAWYTQNGFTCCALDWAPFSYRGYYNWPTAGGGNQHEFRESSFYHWLRRGFTGRYLEALHWGRFLAETAFPRSDGFNWRDKPDAQLDASGFPDDGFYTPANGGQVNGRIRTWRDEEHAHWYSLPYLYLATGDETLKDALNDGVKDRYLNPATAACCNGFLWNPRAKGNDLIARARLYELYRSFGDTADANTVVNNAEGASGVLTKQVLVELNVSGFPGPNCEDRFDCETVSGANFQGVSATRGVSYGCCETTSWGAFINQRPASTFQHAIFLQGVYEYAKAKGSGWADYRKLRDYGWGVSEWARTEMWTTGGCSGGGTGFRFQQGIDKANGGNSDATACGNATVWYHFFYRSEYAGLADLGSRLVTAFSNAPIGGPNDADHVSEHSAYNVWTAIEVHQNPATKRLVDVSLSVTNNGGGSYTLNWTAPANVQEYLLKWNGSGGGAGKSIVDWIGFDPMTEVFTGNPNTTWAWHASPYTASQPSAGAISITVTGLPTSGVDFKMKALTDPAVLTRKQIRKKFQLTGKVR